VAHIAGSISPSRCCEKSIKTSGQITSRDGSSLGAPNMGASDSRLPMRGAVVQRPSFGCDGSSIEATADEFEKIRNRYDTDGVTCFGHDETSDRATAHDVRRLTNRHRRFDGHCRSRSRSVTSQWGRVSCPCSGPSTERTITVNRRIPAEREGAKVQTGRFCKLLKSLTFDGGSPVWTTFRPWLIHAA
jgi:hypothetical protein